MKETKEKVYRCDHCNKAIISKGFMSYHEKWCKRNLKHAHKCFDWCKHLKRVSIKEDDDDDGFESPVRYEFTCDKKNIGLYSYRLEKKFCKHPEKLQERIKGLERMPLECDLFDEMSSELNLD